MPHLEACTHADLGSDTDTALTRAWTRYSVASALRDPADFDPAWLSGVPGSAAFLAELESRLPAHEAAFVRLLGCRMEPSQGQCEAGPTPGSVATGLRAMGGDTCAVAAAQLDVAASVGGCGERWAEARSADTTAAWRAAATTCESPDVWAQLRPALRDRFRADCPPMESGCRDKRLKVAGLDEGGWGLLDAVASFPAPDALTLANLASLSSSRESFEELLASADDVGDAARTSPGERAWRELLAPGLDVGQRLERAERMASDARRRELLLEAKARRPWHWIASRGAYTTGGDARRALLVDAQWARDLACAWAPPMEPGEVTLAPIDAETALAQRAELAEWAAYLFAEDWTASDGSYLPCLASARVTVFRRDGGDGRLLLATLDKLADQTQHRPFARAATCALYAERPTLADLREFLTAVDAVEESSSERAATCLVEGVLWRAREVDGRLAEARTLFDGRRELLVAAPLPDDSIAALERAVAFAENRAGADGVSGSGAEDPLEVPNLVRALKSAFPDPEIQRAAERFGASFQ